MEQLEGFFTVGEMARFSGIPAKTLRYYDEIDLLKPLRRMEGSDYRYYGRRQLEQALLLQSLKSLGMSLQDIKREFQNMSSNRYSQLLQIRADRLDREIDELMHQKRNLHEWIVEVDEAVSAQRETCYIRHYPAMYGYLYRVRVNSRSEHELAMRAVEQRYGGGTHVGRVGRVIAQEDMRRGDYTIYSGYFVPQTGVPPCDEPLVCVPEGDYAVIFAATPNEDSPPYWEKLLDYVDGQGYELCGDGMRTIPVEIGISHREDDYVAKLFFPIRPKTP